MSSKRGNDNEITPTKTLVKQRYCTITCDEINFHSKTGNDSTYATIWNCLNDDSTYTTTRNHPNDETHNHKTPTCDDT